MPQPYDEFRAAEVRAVRRLPEERLQIGTVAELVNRRPNTVRKWEKLGILPENCRPIRDEKGRRWWTFSQIPLIKKWMKEAGMVVGKGLPNYNPDERQLDEVLQKLRNPRRVPST